MGDRLEAMRNRGIQTYSPFFLCVTKAGGLPSLGLGSTFSGKSAKQMEWED